MRAVSELSGGLPRVINLLCDRALEEGYAARRRTIDGSVIRTAAHALGIDEAAAATSPPIRVNATPFASRRSTWSLVIASSLALVAVSIWFAARGARFTVPAVAPAASTSRGSDAGRDVPQANSRASTPEAATLGTPSPSRADASSSSAVPAPSATERFDIVVASFRTDSRATAVAASVAALGLPTYRRVADGWQQVISGPFASRADAGEAQQRLQHAGLSSTQIVRSAR